MAIFLGVGVGEALLWIERQQKEFARIARIGLLAMAALPIVFWFPVLDHKKFVFADDYIANLYREVPQGGVVIGGGDFFQCVTVYNHEVTKYRPDIIPVTGNMFYIFPWHRENLRLNTRLTISNRVESMIKFQSVDEFTNVVDQLVADNPNHQFFVTSILLRDTVVAGTKKGNYHTTKYKLLPYGMLYKIVPLSSKEEPDEKLYNFTFTYPSLMKDTPFYFERNYFGAYHMIRDEYAIALEELGHFYKNHGDAVRALRWYQKAVEQATESNGEFLHNLAIYYAERKEFGEARIYFEKSLAKEPTNRDMMANYQTFLRESKSTTPSGTVAPKNTVYRANGMSFTYPSDWKVKSGTPVVIRNPAGSFTIAISKLQTGGASATDFIAKQTQSYGSLANEGFAKIPNMNEAYLKIWNKKGVKGVQMYEFFLFEGNTVFEVVADPADSPYKKEFDALVSSLSSK